MAQIGNTFYNLSTDDPGIGFPMHYWNQTDTGLIYIRNTADTAWVLVGNGNVETLNLLSRQGGSMVGAINGAHGLIPESGGNTSGQLYLGGDPYVLKSYVDAKIAQLKADASSLISQSFSSIPALDMSSRVARKRGRWAVHGSQGGLVIDLPTYADNTQALESECIWMATMSALYFGYYEDQFTTFRITEVSNRHYTIEAIRAPTVGLDNPGATPSGSNAWDMYIDWMIIAFRST